MRILHFFLPLFCFVAILLTAGCRQSQLKQPNIQKGNLDLRTWDFSSNQLVALNGEWRFSDSFEENPTKTTSFLNVPQKWESSIQQGCYQLSILLPTNHAPKLGLKIDGISTAYELWINGKKIGSVGKIGTTKENTIPQYAHKFYEVAHADTLTIHLKVANFHHYKGGILHPIMLGSYDQLNQANKNYAFTSGLLLGALCVNAFIYFVMFFLMREERYFLFYALFTLNMALHLMCLTDRFLYNFLGESFWIYVYKIELITIFIGMMLKLLFYNSFFETIIPTPVLKVVSIVVGVQALFVLLMPAPFFTYINFVLPFDYTAFLVGILWIFLHSSKNHKQEVRSIIIINIFLICVLMSENLILDKNIHDIQFLHFAMIIYVTGISVMLIKKIVLVFKNEKVLSQSLKVAKEMLENQKQNLEEIVERRTAQLIEAEKQSYELQLKMKERDLDMLAANNILKMQFSKNLITELEDLPQNDKELKPALHSLINKLKGQNTIEERLNTLHKDMDRVNAEFYERINVRFPNLSKTERELCAFIKLNLSNKDIAELRKTSLNTINVTRSRLRKKLGLGRDEELESFIQQI